MERLRQSVRRQPLFQHLQLQQSYRQSLCLGSIKDTADMIEAKVSVYNKCAHTHVTLRAFKNSTLGYAKDLRNFW
ncbi:MAG: hypothetical protein ACFE9C_17900 [Candidatus Hodarchaeota archaeon]